MSRRAVPLIVALSFAATVVAGGRLAAQASRPAAQSAASKSYTPPRTLWGDPKLGGVYSNDDETGIPFERPAQFEGRQIGDISPDELAALNQQRNEQFNAGVAGTESMMPAGYGSYYELIQGKDYVALRYEMIHEHRIVPIDRGEHRPHVGSGIHLDLGDARGWYEGNTLVIETTNFTERSAYRGATEHLKMTERFIPTGPGVVEWRVTFDDPHTWVRPWTFAMTLKLKTQGEQVYEYACHEGNYGLRNILTGARADDAK
jgi:hypothetical protein